MEHLTVTEALHLTSNPVARRAKNLMTWLFLIKEKHIMRGTGDLEFSNTEQWSEGYILILNESDNWLSNRGTKMQRGREAGVLGVGGHIYPFSAALTSAGISLSSAFLQWLFSCQAGEGRGGSLRVTAHLSDWHEKQELPSHSNTKTLSKPPYPPLGIWPRPLDLLSGFSFSACLRNHQLTSSSPEQPRRSWSPISLGMTESLFNL